MGSRYRGVAGLLLAVIAINALAGRVNHVMRHPDHPERPLAVFR